jgi:hypothetical protein
VKVRRLLLIREIYIKENTRDGKIHRIQRG